MPVESESTMKLGDPAPDFELPATDGETYSLSDFEEYDLILIVFTCNHCPYAKAKIDLLNEIAATYDEVAVIGINPNDAAQYPEDSFERMVELVEDGTVAFDVYLRDEAQTVAAAYDAVCTPDPFLFERQNGEHRLVYHGRLDDAPNPDDEPTERTIVDVIDSVLAGDPVTVDQIPSRGCSIKWYE